MALHPQVVLQPLDTGVPNIDTVQEGQHVEDTEDRHDAQIKLANQLLLSNWVDDL